MLGWYTTFVLLGGLFVGSMTYGQESRTAREGIDRPLERLGRRLRPSWSRKTLGGRMWWADVHHSSGWRIQQHVLTKHHRLLDAKNVRHASGTYPVCLNTLMETVPVEDRLRHSARTVVVVHGLGNWSTCLERHAESLREAGYTVVPFDYPSNFVKIDEAAANLAKVVASLPPTDRIDFVGHSMGGIVVRAMLANTADPRFGRVVLIGSPNNGAHIAHMLRDSMIFQLTCGPGGRQLAGGKGSFLETLAAPSTEFACIAGGRKERGYNPFLRGDDDGLVRVESVRLAGATDFIRVPANHHSLLYDDDVRAMTVRFLVDGHLRESGEREPVPALAPFDE